MWFHVGFHGLRVSGGSGYPEKQWELLVSRTALESLELSRQFKLEDIGVLPCGDLTVMAVGVILRRRALMLPPCPATSSSQCHPAISGYAVSSGGYGWWCASRWPLCFLVVSASCFSVNSHFFKTELKKILKKLYTLKTGVCENNLQDGIVWHMRFGKERS